MKTGKFVILTGIISISSSLSASLNLNDVLREMESRGKLINTIQFDFHQRVRFHHVDDISEVRGEAIFSKPGKFRISKKYPDNQTTISNGRKIWVYNPNFNQVWEGASRKWMGMSYLPKGVLPLENYVSDLKENFDLVLLDKEKEQNEIWLMAEPRGAAVDYRLKLCVSTQSWLPIQTIYQSDSAEITTLLSSIRVNSDVPENDFQFIPPKGTEIIPLN